LIQVLSASLDVSIAGVVFPVFALEGLGIVDSLGVEAYLF
jgi:hypothetical protein